MIWRSKGIGQGKSGAKMKRSLSGVNGYLRGFIYSVDR